MGKDRWEVSCDKTFPMSVQGRLFMKYVLGFWVLENNGAKNECSKDKGV